MPELIQCALFLLGAVCTVAGMAQWSVPGAWVLAGGWLIVLAVWPVLMRRLVK